MAKMRHLIRNSVFVLLGLSSPAWAAPTFPTPPTPVNIKVASPLRTGTCANAAALTTYLTPATACGLTNGATFGDLVLLTCGVTYTGNFVLPMPLGSAGNDTDAGGANYVTFQSSQTCGGTLPSSGTRIKLTDKPNMPTLVAPVLGAVGSQNSSLNFAITAGVNGIHHYRFVGLYITTPQNILHPGPMSITPLNYSVSSNYPHHISFERSIIQPDYDYGANVSLDMEAGQYRIMDSILTDCNQLNQAEPKCSLNDYGTGPGLYQNNEYSSGMGEMMFHGGSSFGFVTVTPSYYFQYPSDITIRRNYFNAKISYKYDEVTYLSPAPYPGNGGTMSSTGATVTFANSQTLNGAVGSWIKCTSGGCNGQVVKITNPGIGTVFTTSPSFSPAASADTFRTNVSQAGGGPLDAMSRKNSTEQKAGIRVLYEQNVYQNGWAQSQQNTLTLKGSEYGVLNDIEIRWNQFNNCYVPVQIPDPNSGVTAGGWGASPTAASRIWIHQNAMLDASSTQMSSLGGNQHHGLEVEANGGFAYSAIWGQTGPGGITASAASGPGVVFTSSLNYAYFAFVNTINGVTPGPASIRLRLTTNDDGTGTVAEATLTSADTTLDGNGNFLSNNVTGTVTTGTFPLTQQGWGHWYIGYPAGTAGVTQPLASAYVQDSWIFEHNTYAGSNTGYQHAISISTNQSTRVRTSGMTNYIIRNNIMYSGSVSNPVFRGDTPGGMKNGTTAALPYFTDSSTDIFRKNVFFGPLDSQDYTLSVPGRVDAGGFGSASGTSFVTPDQTGSGNGGPVGFTTWGDYTTGNFGLTPGSQYHNWGTDGLDPGVDWGTLQLKISGVVSGAPEITANATIGGTLNCGGVCNIGQ